MIEKFLVDDKFIINKMETSYNNDEFDLTLSFTANLPQSAQNFKLLLNGAELHSATFNCNMIKSEIGCRINGNIVARIPDVIINKLDVNNDLQVGFSSEEYGECLADFGFRGKNSFIKKVFNIPNSESVLYIVKGRTQVKLKIRPKNYTDSPHEQRKIAAAKILSIFLFKRPILIFEKNGSRYEESGSVVYERMIDSGRYDCYYILDKNSSDYDAIPYKYKKNIIPRFSFKHYLYYFASKKFIGSELMPHAMEIRCVSPLVSKKINKSRYEFIFLQHGVMYMVSLASSTRQANYKKRKNRDMYVVVSSELEKKHFLEYTSLDEEDFILSGLPKMDKSYKQEGADKIAIMPTWRPWEERKCKENFKETSYYKTIKEIVDGVPDELKPKIWIMPHPLIKDYIRKQDNNLDMYLAPDLEYDTLLRNVDILITDYSSISYDAFYRGSNIIFWWKDKDYCMENYGEGTKLMLSKELTFGPVVYSKVNLKEEICKMYKQDQNERYRLNYNKIVQFHDNQNTKRFLKIAKEKGLI